MQAAQVACVGVIPTRVGVNRMAMRVMLRLRVIPTRVGVNLCDRGRLARLDRDPHARGGEPSHLARSTRFSS